jgi:hypothetical protein
MVRRYESHARARAGGQYRHPSAYANLDPTAPPSATASPRLIAFPTDATAPDAATHLFAYLDHAGALLAATGFTLTRTEADGRPFLIARRIEERTCPPMLSYSHGDTVPGMEGPMARGSRSLDSHRSP